MGFKRLKLNDGSSAHISRGTDLNTKAVTAVSTFNSNGSFAPASNNKKYQVFAVGGGAGGGGWRAGGGGAGGAVFFEGVQFSGTSNITIGSKGNGAPSGQFKNGNAGGATSANNAAFVDQSNNKNTLTNLSVAGGGRGAGQTHAGGSGGCGGGSGSTNNTTATGNIGGDGSRSQDGSPNNWRGGGGGGMGSDLTGAVMSGTQAGDGFSFLSTNYSAGGGYSGFYGDGGGGNVGNTNVGGNGGSSPNNGGGYGSGGGALKNDASGNAGTGSDGRLIVLEYEQMTLAGNVANIKKVKKL